MSDRVLINLTQPSQPVRINISERGATGATGAAGADGAPGADGTDGADGADGAPGPNEITSATTSDGTAEIEVLDLEANRRVAVGGLYLIAPPSGWGTTSTEIGAVDAPGDSALTAENWQQYVYEGDPLGESRYSILYLPASPTSGQTVRFRVTNNAAVVDDGEVTIRAFDAPTYTVVETVGIGEDVVIVATWGGSAWTSTTYPATDPPRIEGDLSITGSNVTLSTPLPLSSGGTGANTAPAARTNLELGTGDDVEHRALTLGAGTPLGTKNLMLGPRPVIDCVSAWITVNVGGAAYWRWGINNTNLSIFPLLSEKQIGTTPKTYSQLPAAVAAREGWRDYITDSDTDTFRAVVAGGGAIKTPVYCDGTNWRVG